MAVGNRGSGTVNQTGGSFQVLGNSARTTTIAQLGRPKGLPRSRSG